MTEVRPNQRRWTITIPITVKLTGGYTHAESMTDAINPHERRLSFDVCASTLGEALEKAATAFENAAAES